MCGENDDQFSWPFRSHVLVELLDIFQIKTISILTMSWKLMECSSSMHRRLPELQLGHLGWSVFNMGTVTQRLLTMVII